jgi:tRNA (guanine-N7-)-methyltransferase
MKAKNDMGRRALRKLDQSLDLTGHLKTIDQLPRPWNASLLFGRHAPLEVEIGSGKGLFLRNAAAARPDIDFLGVEIAAKYARFAAAGLAKQNLRNALVVQADALRIFAELLPDASLRAVHAYFPDPWWKMRHKKRRVMRESLIRDVQRTLSAGGEFHFWTDVEEYFHATLKLIAKCAGLQGPLDVPEVPAAHDMDFRTHFERRMRQTNEPIYRAKYLKP